MATAFSYSVGFVVLMLASVIVFAQNDPCIGLTECKACVGMTFNVTKTCTFYTTIAGPECTANDTIAEGTSNMAKTADECSKIQPIPPATTTPAPTTTAATTTPAPTTTAATITTTNATTPAPPTNTTTTAAPPTPTTTVPSTPTTTAAPAPSNGSTTAAPEPATTPTPKSNGGMSVASFFGGIVFTLGVSAVGYLVWRFYKVRMDRNYHTFSNPTF